MELTVSTECTIDAFVCQLHEHGTVVAEVGNLRWRLFTKKQLEAEICHRHEEIFPEAIARAHYQAMVWHQDHVSQHRLPPATGYVWKTIDLFSSQPPASIIHLDIKFVQAEVQMFTSLCVVTRYKRDFLHLTKRGGKISSNVDPRVTFSVERGAFKKTENFVLQLQPVDSATTTRIKEKTTEGSKFLTCSSIVNMEWASESFTEPVYMTLPCPPNPVKAKKAAAARAAKEAKMKNPQMQQMMMEDAAQSKRRDRKKAKPSAHQKQAATTDDDDDRPTTASVTKWYMGQYGNNEDDENDLLHFLKKLPNNRWTVAENVSVVQVKLDLLQLRLDQPILTFMVIRTRTNADAQDAQYLAETIESGLKERVVGVVVRQRIDNQCEVVMAAVPITRLEKVLNQFDDEGYEPGVAANNQEQKDAAIKILNDGDVLEVGFTGNIKCQDPDAKLSFVFNSQLNSHLSFPIIEVDKYLQKRLQRVQGICPATEEVGSGSHTDQERRK
ncbi:hypothetical protein LSH36_251g00013 [Paralvinella palmiformis]|uniref:Uncharacterized protein n=1 Tax=Paralvinella palmiformis TaxID=53620 RepID=A0AAD9JM40_9ANNE|nr:hypothetical protein LSH36_251g00013 [Paralvinella palmiformis]